jgi:hypothetical protein
MTIRHVNESLGQPDDLWLWAVSTIQINDRGLEDAHFMLIRGIVDSQWGP